MVGDDGTPDARRRDRSPLSQLLLAGHVVVGFPRLPAVVRVLADDVRLLRQTPSRPCRGSCGCCRRSNRRLPTRSSCRRRCPTPRRGRHGWSRSGGRTASSPDRTSSRTSRETSACRQSRSSDEFTQKPSRSALCVIVPLMSPVTPPISALPTHFHVPVIAFAIAVSSWPAARAALHPAAPSLLRVRGSRRRRSGDSALWRITGECRRAHHQ